MKQALEWGEGDVALVHEAVNRFCERRLTAVEVRRRDEAHEPPYDLLPEFAELGLIRAPLPVEHGGFGLPWGQFCLIQRRLAYNAYFAASILNRVVTFGAIPIIRFGTERQRENILPRLLDGKALVCLALTEPGAGSDAKGVSTLARRKGDGWCLSGRKTWISDAADSNYLLTLCRTEGETGLTAFLVARETAGIAMTSLGKVGNHCMPSWDIGLDDVLISDECRLGPIGEGFSVIYSALSFSRASMAACALGTARAAFDLAVSHAREREQFGRPIGHFQVIRHRLADMKFEIVKAELLVEELARRIDKGESVAEIAPMAKLASTETLRFVTEHGMQILASAGYALESPMQRYWRDARLYTFGEGTSEIQREIIAKTIGL